MDLGDTRRQRWLVALLGLGALALASRLAMLDRLWELPDSYLLNADSAQYHHYALVLAGLADGELPAIFDLSPLTTVWGWFWHTLFGPSLDAVLVPQVLLLGLGTTLLVASSARRLAGELAGVAAGALIAVCEPLVFYDCSILATPLAVFLAAAVLQIALIAAERPTLARCAGLGLLTGLWIICRPNTGLFLPVAVAVTTLPAARPAIPPRMARAAVLVICAILPVLPITISNAVRGGAFVPVTSSAGINLFIGNNQGATGRLESVFGEHNAIDSFEVFRRQAERIEGRSLDASEVSSFWIAQTGREIADDPGRFAKLLGSKLVYGLNDFEAPDSWNLPFLETELPALASWLPGFGALLALGLPGLFILWRRGPPGRRAVHGVCGVGLITMLAFFVAGRYRAPMIPALAVCAGAAVSWVVSRLSSITDRSADRPDSGPRLEFAKRLAAAALLMALGANLANLPVLESRDDIELERLAVDLAADGRYNEALARVERLVAMAEEREDGAMYERARRTASRIISMKLKNKDF